MRSRLSNAWKAYLDIQRDHLAADFWVCSAFGILFFPVCFVICLIISDLHRPKPAYSATMNESYIYSLHDNTGILEQVEAATLDEAARKFKLEVKYCFAWCGVLARTPRCSTSGQLFGVTWKPARKFGNGGKTIQIEKFEVCPCLQCQLVRKEITVEKFWELNRKELVEAGLCSA